MLTQVQLYSPRITGAELPQERKPILIVIYKVVDRGNGNYEINLSGTKEPFIQTNWLRDDRGFGLQPITPEMAQLLEALGNTWVATGSDLVHDEGLRVLEWGFAIPERYVIVPGLSSYYTPLDRNDRTGSFLGSAIERDDWFKIPGVDYFVQPELARRGENLYETQLYVQNQGLINSSSPNVNRIRKFILPKNPNDQWVREEVERFERNGQNLKEREVIEAYRQLRDHLSDGDKMITYSVRASEILAWPICQTVVEKTTSTLYEKLGRLVRRR